MANGSLFSFFPPCSPCSPCLRGAIPLRRPTGCWAPPRDYTTLITPDGKPKPHHHTVRKERDGTLTPWQPMGVCAAKDGAVYVLTIAPFTLIKFDQFRAN